MRRRQFIQSIVLGLAGLSGHASARLMNSYKPLTIGIFPRRNIRATYELFSPLGRYLEDVLRQPVRIVTERNFSDFWRGIEEGRYDLVHYNQYHYIVSSLLHGYEVIAMNEEFGEATISGCLMVRKDSGLGSVAELKGRTILFGGGPRAMQSYIAPTWLLRQAGLVQGDYVEKFALNPPNAVISTHQRQSDAAGSGDVAIRLDIVKKSIDVSAMKFLACTPPLPQLPWAVRDTMPEEMKLRIQSAMTALAESGDGRNILHTAKLSGIRQSSDGDYDPDRAMIRDVYGADYGVSMLSAAEQGLSR